MRGFKLTDVDLGVLVFPLAIAIVSVVSFVLFIRFGYSDVTRKLQELEEVKKSSNTLEERSFVLKEFETGIKSDRGDLIYTVLPDRNPTALTVSQVKNKISELNLGFLGIDSFSQPDSKGEGEINTSTATYKLEASDVGLVMEFLLWLDRVAPVLTIEEASVVRDKDDLYLVEVDLKSYWAKLPVQLPSLKDPVQSLTSEERELLSRVLSYDFPFYVNLTPKLQGVERPNPFN